MGSFENAIALATVTGGSADIAAVRQYQGRGGVSMNIEQEITSDLGAFIRAGWADGNVEPYEFTDIDRTVAGGVSLSGKQWGRPDDTVGVAGVVNGIASVHQAFFNAGGLGILIGDGQLPNPGLEQIIEAYYSYALRPLRRGSPPTTSSSSTRPTTLNAGPRMFSLGACTHNSNPGLRGSRRHVWRSRRTKS